MCFWCLIDIPREDAPPYTSCGSFVAGCLTTNRGSAKMEWFDILILGILLFFTWRGAQRGLVTQLAWMAAIILCFKFSDSLAPSITPHIAIGEPDNPVRHWVAMFLLFLGFTVVSFAVAWQIEGSIGKSRQLKDLDRFFGGVLGLVRGGVIAMIVTFFAVTWDATKPSVVKSQTGPIAWTVLDWVKPLEPQFFHEYLQGSLKKFREQMHGVPGREELGTEASPESFYGLNEDLNGPSLSDNGPRLDDLWRRLPSDVRSRMGDSIQDYWKNASAQGRQALLDQVTSHFDYELPDVIRDVISGSESGTSTPSSGQGTPKLTENQMLREIAEHYGDKRDWLLRGASTAFQGVPGHIRQRVIEDWYADFELAVGRRLATDPDPGTGFATLLDRRILRQLQAGRVDYLSLDSNLRRRLDQYRR